MTVKKRQEKKNWKQNLSFFSFMQYTPIYLQNLSWLLFIHIPIHHSIIFLFLLANMIYDFYLIMILNSSNVHGRVTCNKCNFIYNNILNIMLYKVVCACYMFLWTPHWKYQWSIRFLRWWLHRRHQHSWKNFYILSNCIW